MAIMDARYVAERTELLNIAQMHLAWLLTPREVAGDACRSVIEGTFVGGMPIMREDWVRYEASLAATFLMDGILDTRPPQSLTRELPEWGLVAAAAQADLPIQEVAERLVMPAHPRGCDTRIAILEALLDRADDVPDAAFRSL